MPNYMMKSTEHSSNHLESLVHHIDVEEIDYVIC